MTKAALRAEVMAAREALPAPVAAEASERITRAALALPELARCRRIALYLSRAGEVDTRGLLRACQGLGMEISVPFHRAGVWGFTRMGSGALADGPLGTRQPGTIEPTDPATMDVIVVPCVGVDPACGRLGHGKGIYDRLLAGATGALIGLAFDFQVFPAVPMEPHDRRLDRVVTETRVFARGISPGAAG